MKIKIYSKDNCPYCDKAKKFFKQMNMQFMEINVGRDIQRDTYYEITGMKTLPAIYVDNKLIGGYTELVEYASIPGNF